MIAVDIVETVFPGGNLPPKFVLPNIDVRDKPLLPSRKPHTTNSRRIRGVSLWVSSLGRRNPLRERQ